MHVEGTHQSSAFKPVHEARPFRVDVAACEKLKALLNGRDEVKKAYLRDKPFSFEHLPEWLRAEAFQLAKLEFDKVSTTAVLTDLYTRFLAHPRVPAYFSLKATPVSVSSRLRSTDTLKKDIAQSLSKFLPVPFTTEIFKQVGVDSSATLEQLVNVRAASVTLGEEEVSASKPLGSVPIRVFNEAITIPVLLPAFDPRLEGHLGRAAAAVREVIGSRIVAFALVSDIFQTFGVELEESKVQKIVKDIQQDPWLKAKNSPVIRSLIAYSEHLVAEGIPSKIAPQEVFGSFAYHRNPIDDMRSENKRRERVSETPAAAVAPKTQPSPALTMPPVDPTTSKLKEIIESRTGENVDSIGNGMRLLRLCLSQGVSPRDLERMIDAHAGDPLQVIRAVQRGPTLVEREREVLETEEPSCTLKTSSAPRFLVYAHTGDNGFSKWYDSLSAEEQGRVSEVVSDVAHERFGKARPIKTSKFSGIYEIRIMDLGTRVYFRYLAGQRILLLCGGHKSDQQRDINRAYQYSKEYEPRRNEGLDESSRFPVISPEDD